MATLKDVAQAAGLNVGTVSRILNNRGYISEETRARVYGVMEELHYQPNELARSLSKKKTNTIGLIVPHIVHPYFSAVISSVEQAAYHRKYKLLLCNSNEDSRRELEYIELCRNNRVDGILLCSASVDAGLFTGNRLPTVALERGIGPDCASVECDNLLGGTLAARHLIACGCKHLVHISGLKDTAMPADEREAGFLLECARQGVEARAFKTDSSLYYLMEYHPFIGAVLRDNPQTDGLFASSDLIAAQAIQACRGLGLRTPEDVQIVGFDDVLTASLTAPTLTTIHQPMQEMAERAVSLLLAQIEGETVPARTVLPVHLVQRESTRPITQEESR